MALSLLTLMLGGALATKPRATKRDATTMIRGLGFGLERNAVSHAVDSAAVKLIKRGPDYSILKRKYFNSWHGCGSTLLWHLGNLRSSIFLLTLPRSGRDRDRLALIYTVATTDEWIRDILFISRGGGPTLLSLRWRRSYATIRN